MVYTHMAVFAARQDETLIPRESARASARSGAGFCGISGGYLEAPGLVAVVVRDALGCLLMGLVHDWLLGRCTLPPAPCCRGHADMHADVGWHGLAQLE